MESSANDLDPAFAATALDPLGNALSRSGSAPDMGTYLTEALRKLTGARTVVFVEWLSTPTAQRVVSVNPEGQREWAGTPAADRLHEIVRDLRTTHVWRPGDSSEAAELLREHGFGLSLAVPLCVGTLRVGAMLVLGLPEEDERPAVVAVLEVLATAVALVLRNASLAEEQEQLLPERTARLQAGHEALREKEALLGAMAGSAPIVIRVVDREGVFRLSTGPSPAALGLEPEEVVGRSVFDVYADYPDIITATRRALGGETVSFVAAVGPTVWDFRMGPLMAQGDPGPMGAVGVALDITDRTRTEEALQAANEALRASEARLRALIENVNDVIVTMDLQGTTTFVSPAVRSVLGYTEEETLGLNAFDFVHPDDRAEAQRQLAGVVGEPGRAARMDLRLRHRDGSWREVEVVGSVAAAGGGATGVVLIYRDMTERRELERQAGQASRLEAIGQLAGGVAHDFNNLLTGIIGHADLALAAAPDGQLRRDLTVIRELGDRAAALTRQLLAFSRQQAIEPRIVDANALIRDLAKMLGRIIGEDVRLQLELAPGLDRVRADPGQLEQVLMNLVVNARDAMPAGGTLTVETATVVLDQAYAKSHPGAAPGRYVRIAVSDTGCGMNEVTRAHIFEPFFTTKEVGKGTGLGLATVWGVVKQHGGSIEVYSEAGVGTTFKVYLPATEDVAPDAVGAVAIPHPECPPATILLAEDEPAVREMVRQILVSHGHTVLVAANAEEAERLADSFPGELSLLITDVVMPGRTGAALYESLVRQRAGLKVLFMSGYTTRAVFSQGALREGRPFLPKPFTVTVLLQKVAEVLQS